MKLSHVIEVSPPDRKHQVKGIKKHMAQKKGKDKIPKTYVDKKTGKRKKTNPWALAWAQYDKYGVPSRIEKDQKRGLMPINNGTKRCVSVVLRDQKDLEHALRLLKRKLKRENFYVELRRREFYQKPSEIKKAKKRRRKAIDGTELKQCVVYFAYNQTYLFQLAYANKIIIF